MVITYYGSEYFKIQFGETVLGFNPISKEAAEKGEKPPRFGADIAFVSLSDPQFNGVQNLSVKEKEPFVLAGPGEYEIKDVFVKGYPSKSTFGDEEGGRLNTVYSAKLEGIHLLFLGAYSDPNLDEEIRSDFGAVDILFVPIGGKGVLEAQEAYKLSVNLNPKLIIPMHYEGVEAESDALNVFLKDAGVDKPEPVEKLKVKPRDLAEKENEVVVLKRAGS